MARIIFCNVVLVLDCDTETPNSPLHGYAWADGVMVAKSLGEVAARVEKTITLPRYEMTWLAIRIGVCREVQPLFQSRQRSESHAGPHRTCDGRNRERLHV